MALGWPWTDFREEVWNLVGKFGIEWDTMIRAPISCVFLAQLNFLAQPKIPESDSVTATMTLHMIVVFLGRKIFSERKKCFPHTSSSSPGLFF